MIKIGIVEDIFSFPKSPRSPSNDKIARVMIGASWDILNKCWNQKWSNLEFWANGPLFKGPCMLYTRIWTSSLIHTPLEFLFFLFFIFVQIHITNQSLGRKTPHHRGEPKYILWYQKLWLHKLLWRENMKLYGDKNFQREASSRLHLGI